MTTAHAAPETSLTLAFAELGRLEQQRASFTRAKRAACEQLGQQARMIAELRERLLAERPRAWARVRRERVRQGAREAASRRELVAASSADHHERMRLAAAQLEAKRQRLAALQAENATRVVRPGRRALEWSMPAAATMLVAFLGLLAFGEDQAVADAPHLDVIAGPAEPAIDRPVIVIPPAVEVPAPEPVVAQAPEPTPEPTKAKSTKSTKAKSTKSKSVEPKSVEPKPLIKKNSRPIELGSFGDDPLG